MAENEELAEGQESKKKKPGFNIMGLLITVIIAVVVSGGVSFALIQLLGSNTPADSGNTTVVQAPVEIRVRFIPEGSNKTFMLKGGKDVIVISLLSFTVGSDGCRAEVANKNDQIVSALQDLFIQKERVEVPTPAGLELLKRQIRDLVNRVTGYIGDKARFGVLEVNIHILSIASTQ